MMKLFGDISRLPLAALLLGGSFLYVREVLTDQPSAGDTLCALAVASLATAGFLFLTRKRN